MKSACPPAVRISAIAVSPRFTLRPTTNDMDAQLGQFVSYSTTNTTRSSCNKCGCSHFLKSFFTSQMSKN